jgi:predicted ATPase
MQMPGLVRAADLETLRRRTSGATRERMLRELTEALELLTAQQPLLLVLEDLHWSDPSTLDLIAVLARRQEPARLLLLGTYRSPEVRRRAHPVHTVTQELQLHGHSVEVPLTLLSAEVVAVYLASRLPGLLRVDQVARLVHQRTEGNPLFMVLLVESWQTQGLLLEQDGAWTLSAEIEALHDQVPDSLRQYIEQHLEQLAEADQALLEAASVAGSTFTIAAMAAGVAQAPETLEARATALARQGRFIRASGTETWPDGTVTACYQFLHALYHEVVYARVSAGHRVRLHQQIGARKEAGYGAQARQIAAELAVHFVRGHDAARAVHYLHDAAEQALQRSANQEAIQHLTAGLAQLATLPETLARAQQELDLHIALGAALRVTKGQAAPEVEQTFARARVLCEQLGETPQLVPVLRGLCLFYQNRGALSTARELGEQCYRLVQHEAAPLPRLDAHHVLGGTLFYLGDYVAAWTHLEQGIALIDPAAGRAQAHRHGAAYEVNCLAFGAWTLWCLGYPEQAMQRGQEALALAQKIASPTNLALAHHFVAYLHHRRREPWAVQEQAEPLLTLATAQAFPLWVGFGTCWRGWVLAMQGQHAGGLAQLHQGMTALLETGQALARPFCLVLLAEAAAHAGQVEEGLALLEEALAALETSARGDLRAEVSRLKGELLLRQTAPDMAQAEACFQQALTVARRQQARSWELRAATSLSRLWQHQGKRAAAYDLLAPVYGWFTEGFDTADLQEARALLAALGE